LRDPAAMRIDGSLASVGRCMQMGKRSWSIQSLWQTRTRASFPSGRSDRLRVFLRYVSPPRACSEENKHPKTRMFNLSNSL
jgi:hypothetical protein